MNLFPFSLLPYYRRGERGQRMAWWDRQYVACGVYTPWEYRKYSPDHVYVARKTWRGDQSQQHKWKLFVGDLDGVVRRQHTADRFGQILAHVGPAPPPPPAPFVAMDPIWQAPMIVSPVEYRIEHGHTGQIALTISLLGGLGRLASPSHLRLVEREGLLDLYVEKRRLEVLGPLSPLLEDSPDKMLCVPGQIDLEAYRRGWDDLLRQRGAFP